MRSSSHSLPGKSKDYFSSSATRLAKGPVSFAFPIVSEKQSFFTEILNGEENNVA
jgi:hypothetical protein